jgi:hypothetical protein
MSDLVGRAAIVNPGLRGSDTADAAGRDCRSLTYDSRCQSGLTLAQQAFTGVHGMQPV